MGCLEPAKGYGGAALAGLGSLLLFGSYVYDFLEGIAAIEETRSQARFKYGQLRSQEQAGLSVQPTLNPVNGSAGISVGMRF